MSRRRQVSEPRDPLELALAGRVQSAREHATTSEQRLFIAAAAGEARDVSWDIRSCDPGDLAAASLAAAMADRVGDTRRIIARWRAVAGDRPDAFQTALVAEALLSTGQVRDAQRELTRAQPPATPAAMAATRLSNCRERLFAADLETAGSLAARGRRESDGSLRLLFTTLAGYIAALQGHEDEATTCLHAAFDGLDRARPDYLQIGATTLLAGGFGVLGRSREAIAAATAYASRDLGRRRIDLAYAIEEQIHWAIAAGDRDAVAGLAERLDDDASSAAERASLLRCRASIEYARSDWAASARYSDQAIRITDRLGIRLLTWRARLLRAAAHASDTGHDEVFHRAEHRVRDEGLPGLADQLRRELRGMGARLGAVRRELTPRQEEIADLVSRGLTNREIGRRLGLSEATVHTHVGLMLKRRGVTNRTALAAQSEVRTYPASVLTSRQREVLALVQRGYTDAAIAFALNLSPRTAEKHVADLRVRLGIPGRAGLAAVRLRDVPSPLDTVPASAAAQSR